MNSAVLHVGLLVCSLHFKLLATEIEQRVISEACLLAFACMQVCQLVTVATKMRLVSLYPKTLFKCGANQQVNKPSNS